MAAAAIPATADNFIVGDETYGTSAIEIAFSWDGNVNDAPTNFEWSTPLSSGILTSSDIAFWDSSGFPEGITNLAVYLLTADPEWSEDCTGPLGGVGPAFCDESGSRIDLNVRDAAVGTYGFELNGGDLTQLDRVTSGTLVEITPEPSTFALLGAAGLLLLKGKMLRALRDRSAIVTRLNLF